MTSWFKKTGIISLDRSKVLQHLPQKDVGSPLKKKLIGDNFLQNLAGKMQDLAKKGPSKKRKKLDVSAGISASSKL